MNLQKLPRKGEVDGETMGQIPEKKIQGKKVQKNSLTSWFLNAITEKYNITIRVANSFFSQEYNLPGYLQK